MKKNILWLYGELPKLVSKGVLTGKISENIKRILRSCGKKRIRADIIGNIRSDRGNSDRAGNNFALCIQLGRITKICKNSAFYNSINSGADNLLFCFN